MRVFEVVRSARLDEISELYEPLRRLAEFFAGRYRDFDRNIRPCLLRAFPEACEAGGNVAVPIRNAETATGPESAAGSTCKLAHAIRKEPGREVAQELADRLVGKITRGVERELRGHVQGAGGRGP